MDILRIPHTLINEILAHAQQSPDKEVCGLIAGNNREAKYCYPVANVSPTPERRFQMDAKAQIDAMRRMRESGLELIAIYHSHPTGPTNPSLIDIEEANYPAVAQLIISLDTQGVLQISGFNIDNGSCTPLGLDLI